MGIDRLYRLLGARRVGGVVGLAALACAALAGTAFADEDQDAVAQAEAAPLVAGTPCTTTASSCVDLDSQKAWLFRNGAIIRGPVPIASGGNGKPTPIAHSDRVYRKDRNHKSYESRLPNGQPAPMPWSVFFADGGIAFHAGSPTRSSAGCVHLNPADAQAWFNTLQIGDQVQVVRASQELPKHKGQKAVSKAPDTSKDSDSSKDSDNSDSDDKSSSDSDSNSDSDD